MRIKMHLRDPGNQDQVRCGVIGCDRRVLFWCRNSTEWVCYEHGALLLREEWGYQDTPDGLLVDGTLSPVHSDKEDSSYE